MYPTDTAYGLGAKFSDKSAAKRIYKIKDRPGGKPLPVIIGSLAMAKRFFRFSARELTLAKKYWPGPLSLLLERQIRNSKHETRNKKGNVRCQMSQPKAGPPLAENVRCSVVVRVPDSKIARQLSRAVGEPIFSTSANLSGKGECYSAKEVVKQFRNRKNFPDLIFDGARLRKKKPSTIIRVIGDKIEVLRKGPVRLNYKFKAPSSK